jgi:hypothetical protein
VPLAVAPVLGGRLLADHKDELETEAPSALVAELDLEERQTKVVLGER